MVGPASPGSSRPDRRSRRTSGKGLGESSWRPRLRRLEVHDVRVTTRAQDTKLELPLSSLMAGANHAGPNASRAASTPPPDTGPRIADPSDRRGRRSRLAIEAEVFRIQLRSFGGGGPKPVLEILPHRNAIIGRPWLSDCSTSASCLISSICPLSRASPVGSTISRP